MILIESDGLTRNVPSWRTDVLSEIVGRLGLERTMFEADEPNVFEWFIRNYGSKVISRMKFKKIDCHGVASFILDVYVGK